MYKENKILEIHTPSVTHFKFVKFLPNTYIAYAKAVQIIENMNIRLICKFAANNLRRTVQLWAVWTV